MSIPKFTNKERVDLGDMQASSQLNYEALRTMVLLAAQQRFTATDLGRHLGSVLTTSAIAFASPDITIPAGMVLVLANENGVAGNPGPFGDILEVESLTTVSGACPTVGVPDVLLMARPSSLTDSDVADRVFYKSTAVDKEEILPIETRSKRTIQWYAVDASDGVTIATRESEGYCWVATLNYNGGAPLVSTWHYLFPTASGIYLPGGQFKSIIQVLHAFEAQIAKLQGTSDAWAAPASTIAALKVLADAFAVSIGDLQTDMNTVLNPPRLCLTTTLVTSLPPGQTAIDWDTEVYDSHGLFDVGVSTSDVIIPALGADGTYRVSVKIPILVQAGESAAIDIDLIRVRAAAPDYYFGETRINADVLGSDRRYLVPVVGTIQLQAGDHVVVKVTNTGVDTLNTQIFAQALEMERFYIG